jgi:ribosomal protein S18 acetylase RimI-like enzyme
MNPKNPHIQNLIYKLIPIKFYFRKIGINLQKLYVYSINLDNINPTILQPANLTIKVCKKDDLHLFGKLKDKFLLNILENHILIGAFINGQLAGYIWISLEKAKVDDIERIINFEGAYIFDLYVKKDFRQRKIASNLINFSLNQIKNVYKKKNAYAIVETSNFPSIKTFKRNKFTKMGVIRFYRILLWQRYEENLFENKISFTKY